ncbi:hypothetical protein LB465_00145 [Salegentibacter sp. LM13S]|uniref:hypothetical protein n=1 Tax=Salegentibacter lacus TaxID=2873599 RepID=UPI001CCD960A|nr:hypothetical protein [Salegentibacter lacus]MBZ9629168.1 hypothetical protein [Salegentibacter lacus]
MQKILLILAFLSLPFIGTSQTSTSVENSTYGVQTGFLGIWGYNESRLSNEIALRTEIGLDASIFGGAFLPKTGVIFVPTINLEPRWYYNLSKRENKSKRIENNSGNFLSLKGTYRPDLFTISNYDNISVIPNLSLIPTWGIRRHIGSHFNYEAGIGFGYNHIFAKSAGYAEDEGELAVNLHLRIGYSF